MKILASPSASDLNDTHNYEKGGSVSNISYNLIHSICQHDVDFYTCVKSTSINNPIKNLHIKKVGGGHIKPFILSNYYSHKFIKSQKPDIITQFYFFYETSFNPHFSAITKYPFLIGMAEVPHLLQNDELNSFTKLFRTPLKNMIYPLFHHTLENCDRLIVVNEATKNIYSKYISSSKINVIPYGVDLNRFQYTQNIDPQIHNILVTGRLIKRRNIDKLIEVLPQIIQEYPNTTVSIVGTGPQETYLKRITKNLNVNFYGNVSSQTLVNMYQNSTLLCHLSEADGWNQPALEAMACGRPVVCMDALHNSMVEHEKTGFKIKDTDDLLNAILKLFNDKTQLEKISEQCRKHVETNYNWNAIGKQYYDEYKSLI